MGASRGAYGEEGTCDHYSHDIHDEAGPKGDARPVLSTKAHTDTSYSLKLTDVSIASQSSITCPVARSCLSPFVRTLAISRHIILPAAAATSSPPLPQSHHISLPYAPPHNFNARRVMHSLVATGFYQRQTGDVTVSVQDSHSRSLAGAWDARPTFCARVLGLPGLRLSVF